MPGESASVRIPVETVKDNGRERLTVGGQRVVVFPYEDHFVGYVDICAHQGGPVCSQGTLHAYLTASIAPDGRVNECFADDGALKVLACPWHGWEYWLENGRCIADSSKSLRKVRVEMEGSDLIISL